MKTTKKILFSLMLLISLSSAAANFNEPAKFDPFSEEISKMLSRSSLVISEDLTIKVLFTLTENKVIQINSISSSNKTVNKFLRASLSIERLKGENWEVGKVYILPVRVKAIR